MIRVLIADDHKILRQGLTCLLESTTDLAIAGEARDGFELVELARQTRPDVVVTDVGMPDLPADEAVRTIRRNDPRIEVLVLTMHDDRPSILRMLQAGARSYLLKRCDGPELLSAVRETSRGNSVIDPEIARDVVTLVTSRDRTRAADELTTRERQIFEYVAAGKTSRAIGQILGLSPKTIDNCRANILDKLHVANQVEAVAVGLQRGLIRAGSSSAVS